MPKSWFNFNLEVARNAWRWATHFHAQWVQWVHATKSQISRILTVISLNIIDLKP
jgi:hypothetical protein